MTSFGLKLNTINDNEPPFRKHGKSIFAPLLRTLFRELCVMINSTLLKIIRVKDFPQDASAFFHVVFKETITYRLENKTARNDFVQCLMQSRNDLVLNTDLPKMVRYFLFKLLKLKKRLMCKIQNFVLEKCTESQIVANAYVIFANWFQNCIHYYKLLFI